MKYAHIWFLTIFFGIFQGIQAADVASVEKLKMHPDAFEKLRTYCRAELVKRGKIFESQAASATQSLVPEKQGPVEICSIEIKQTDTTLRLYCDLQSPIALNKAFSLASGLCAVSKSNSSRRVVIPVGEYDILKPFFLGSGKSLKPYALFPGDQSKLYPITAAELRTRLNDKKIVEPCTLSEQNPLHFQVTVLSQAAQKPKRLQINRKQKQEKVISSNLEVLLEKSAGRHFNNELYNSEATTYTVQEAIRNTIKAYRPRWKESEIMSCLDSALYENLKKSK